MDVLAIAKLSTTIAETGTKQEVGMTMLKKQQDMQKQHMSQLLEGIQPPKPAQNLPAHLGSKINTTA
ncbi:YjfB family protein [Massilia suwonensis]|uniref:YjfB family protein n=1 Tax=Massilia suwonensis TaxID=648895 RepID=A0ABW0MEU8_9BURK